MHPKWVRSLAAMLVGWDIVQDNINLRTHLPRSDFEYIRSIAGVGFYHPFFNLPFMKLKKVIKYGCGRNVENKSPDPYTNVDLVCLGLNVLDRPCGVWRQTILLGEDIVREIDTMSPDMVCFDETMLPSLLNLVVCCAGFLHDMIPLARGFLLYGLGETLIDYGKVEMIDRWYEIVREKQPSYFEHMVIPKPNRSDVQIGVPDVLIGIIISYTRWELRSRSEVMNWLFEIQKVHIYPSSQHRRLEIELLRRLVL